MCGVNPQAMMPPPTEEQVREAQAVRAQATIEAARRDAGAKVEETQDVARDNRANADAREQG